VCPFGWNTIAMLMRAVCWLQGSSLGCVNVGGLPDEAEFSQVRSCARRCTSPDKIENEPSQR